MCLFNDASSLNKFPFISNSGGKRGVGSRQERVKERNRLRDREMESR